MENRSKWRNLKCQKYLHEPPAAITQSLIVMNIVCAVATIVLNSMICAAVYKTKSLRKPSNFLLVSLSAAQFLVTVDFVSQTIFLSFHNLYTKRLCIPMGMYHYITIVIIIFHLAAISVDRLIAIQWHLRYRSIVTKRRMIACVTVLWITALLLSFVPRLLSSADTEKEIRVLFKFLIGCHGNRRHRMYRCNTTYRRNLSFEERLQKRRNAIDKARVYMAVNLIVNLALPFLIIALCYAVILRVSMKHYKQINGQMAATSVAWKEIRAAKTVFIIIGSFLLFFSPAFAVSLVGAFMKPCWKCKRAIRYLVTVQSLSAVFNPLVYAVRNSEFRAAFKTILRLKVTPEN